jgi:hypothetical protein
MLNRIFGTELVPRKSKIPGHIRTTRKERLGTKKKEINRDFYTKKRKWLLNEKEKNENSRVRFSDDYRLPDQKSDDRPKIPYYLYA